MNKNEQQHCEIIHKISLHPPPNKHSLSCEYGVDEKAIRKIWEKRVEIEEHSALMTTDAKSKTFRTSVGQFKEVEDCLFIWIDAIHRASLPVPPSLTLLKARSIATELVISDFKASWQWLNDKGGEVNKDDPELLVALDEFCEVVKEYNPEHVYNMDETGLFYRQTPCYSLLLPDEDLSTTR